MLFNRTKNRQSEVRSTTFTEIFLVFLVILFLFVIKKDLEIADLKNNNVLNLQKEIEKLKTKISNLKDKVIELKTKNNDLEDEVARLKIYAGALPIPGEPPPPTYEELTKEISALKINIRKLETYIKELEIIKNKYEDLTSKGSGLNEMISNLQKENLLLKKENKRLKLENRQLLLDSKICVDSLKICSRGGMDHPRCTIPNTTYVGNRNEYLFHISVHEKYFLISSRWEKEDEKYMIKIPGISDSIKSGGKFSDKEFINLSKKILNWGINNKNGECRFYIRWSFNNSGRFLSTDRAISAPDIISRYYYQWKQSIGN